MSIRPARMLVQLSEADLDERDERLLATIVAELHAQSAPALDDIDSLSKALRISKKTLQRLRAEPGFPELRLLDSPRFDRADVLAWIRARSAGTGLRVIGGGT